MTKLWDASMFNHGKITMESGICKHYGINKKVIAIIWQRCDRIVNILLIYWEYERNFKNISINETFPSFSGSNSHFNLYIHEHHFIFIEKNLIKSSLFDLKFVIHFIDDLPLLQTHQRHQPRQFWYSLYFIQVLFSKPSTASARKLLPSKG